MYHLLKGTTRHIQLWGDEGNYPESFPVVIGWNHDLGWIIEAVENGEYEVQNMPFYEERNTEINWDLAFEEAKRRGVRIRYYHRWT